MLIRRDYQTPLVPFLAFFNGARNVPISNLQLTLLMTKMEGFLGFFIPEGPKIADDVAHLCRDLGRPVRIYSIPELGGGREDTKYESPPTMMPTPTGEML